MSNIEINTKIVKEEAHKAGFMYCGISEAAFLEDHAPRLEKWLFQNMHGKMSYMENYFDKRLDPRKLVEGATTVVSLLYNYYPDEDLSIEGLPKISKYAYGKDYHFVVKDKLKAMLSAIRDRIGDVSGRVFVDSAPVLDRAWAEKSGLGWIGKNGNLIHPKAGSFFFLAELIIDLPLMADGPIKDYCGTCTKCIDACPTEAIVAPKIVDGSKCISYFTIELKEQIPAEMKGQFANWAFGCDVCQDVCPWNRFSKPHRDEELKPSAEMKAQMQAGWEDLTEEVFKLVAKESPLKRTGFKGLKRNLDFLKIS